RRLLIESEARAVIVIVSDVLAEQSPEMTFVEYDDVVEQLSAYTSDPALRDSILPRAAVCSPRRFDAERRHRRYDLRGENRIAVEDQMPRRRLEPERLPQLLDDPRRCRLVGDVEVEDATTRMIDCEPRIDQMERHRRDYEEIHRRDRVAVVAQELDPALESVRSSAFPRQISLDGALRHDESDHHQP